MATMLPDYAAGRNGLTVGRGFCDACHKSHSACPASQDSGVVSVSEPIRMASLVRSQVE